MLTCKTIMTQLLHRYLQAPLLPMLQPPALRPADRGGQGAAAAAGATQAPHQGPAHSTHKHQQQHMHVLVLTKRDSCTTRASQAGSVRCVMSS